MIGLMKKMTNRTGQALSATVKPLTRIRYIQYALAAVATVCAASISQMAYATVSYTAPTVGETGLENTTYTVYDICNSILAVIYPAIIPILVAGSTVFAAWWVWHRLRGAVS